MNQLSINKKNKLYNIFTIIYMIVIAVAVLFIINHNQVFRTLLEVYKSRPFVYFITISVFISATITTSSAILFISIPLIRHYYHTFIEDYYIINKKKNTTIKDVFKNKELYENINPVYISLLANYKLEHKKDLCLAVLNVINLGYVKDNHKELIVLEDKIPKDIKESNKYIIDLIRKNELDKFDCQKFTRIIINEMFDDKYFKYAPVVKKRILFILVIVLLIILSLTISFITIRVLSIIKYNTLHYDACINFLLISSHVTIAFILVIAACFVYIIIGYAFKKNNLFIKTSLSYDALDKLFLLKRYLNNFSAEDVENVEELAKWKYYYTYSIALNTDKNHLNNFYSFCTKK